MDHKNIQEAIRAIYAEVGYVQKQHSPELRYTYAGEAAFIAELRPAMIEHGVTVSVANMSDLTQETYTTARGTAMMRSTLHAVIRFIHVSGTSIDVQAYGEGSDSGDKSVNKAMTDAYKYALRQTFMIETGDDPDKDESQERGTNSNYKAKPVAQRHEQPDKPYTTGGNSTAPMSLEFAESETNKDGVKYGALDTATISHMANSLGKITPRTDEQERKLAACKVILAHRASGQGA